MVPTPEATTSRQSAGSARSRNETPPPRAKGSAKATAKAAASPSAEAHSTAASSAAPKVEEPKTTGAEQSSSTWADDLQGLEPPAWCVVISGLVLGAAVLAVIFPGERAIEFWVGVRDPLEKVLTEHADMLVAFSAMACFSPLAALGLVTLCRAVSDLQYLNLWQTSVLGLLCSIAWGTLVLSEGPTRDTIIALPKNSVEFWDTWSDPIEKVLVHYSSSIVAGAALITLLPLALLMVTVVVRAVWNCRVKIVIDEKAKGTEETTAA